MDAPRFKEVISAFLDSSDHFALERGEIILQLGSELISASASQKDGMLYVKEDGIESRAESWIAQRLAMLPLLAERILSAIPDNPAFVTPKGVFLDEINRSVTDSPIQVDNAVAVVQEFLNRRPGGTCSVLYLTSDAGEGKTTLINHFARLQAKRFKERQSDWLLVPINLGGKPFLRFDDVVVAGLMNQLRYQRLYFDGFLQLVRLGMIIPALDGFEEIFVETSEGDAISSLGTLIRQLRGEGNLLIAARKAYFEFRALKTQARLLDALPDADVAFGRVGLARWGEAEFIKYCELMGRANAEQLYQDVTGVVGLDHPLVTRPVLVRQLVDLAESLPSNALMLGLKLHAHTFFSWLVDKLLEREAKQKWIDKHGDPPKPLLTVQEHHELLSYIAEEMWISRTATLTAEMLDSLADLFCDSKKHSPVVTRQVRERLKQHALIIAVGQGKKEFAFDHDDFREFFLGEQLAIHLTNDRETDIRKIFRMDTLPTVAIQSALSAIAQTGVDMQNLINLVLRVGLSEGSSTFVRENAGALLAILLPSNRQEGFIVDGIVFPPQSLALKSILDVTFRNCYFRPTGLQNTELMNCQFLSCEFEHLGLIENSATIRNSTLSRDTHVHSITRVHETEPIDLYDPAEIATALMRAGFTLEPEQMKLRAEVRAEPDQDLRIAEKALQTFTRSTVVSEGTFRLRLSVNASRFMDSILPRLLRAGILETTNDKGQKYRLGIPLSQIAEALSDCRGSFNSFLELANREQK
jgi:hypothetical protein